MIVVVCAIAGALFGALAARKRGGKLADIAQYAVASAMVFGIIGMIATVLLHRLAM